MIPAVKRGDAVAESAGGEPPGVVDEHVERAEALDGRRDHRVDLVGFAHVGGDEEPAVGQVFGLVAAADRDVRAGVGEALRDAPPDAATPAGDEHDAGRRSAATRPGSVTGAECTI